MSHEAQKVFYKAIYICGNKVFHYHCQYLCFVLSYYIGANKVVRGVWKPVWQLEKLTEMDEGSREAHIIQGDVVFNLHGLNHPKTIQKPLMVQRITIQ